MYLRKFNIGKPFSRPMNIVQCSHTSTNPHHTRNKFFQNKSNNISTHIFMLVCIFLCEIFLRKNLNWTEILVFFCGDLTFTPDITNGCIFSLFTYDFEMTQNCDSTTGFFINLFISQTAYISLCYEFKACKSLTFKMHFLTNQSSKIAFTFEIILL